MEFVIVLFVLPIVLIAWLLLQRIMGKQDPLFKGFQPGCGGCSKKGTCGSSNKEE